MHQAFTSSPRGNFTPIDDIQCAARILEAAGGALTLSIAATARSNIQTGSH